MEKKANIVVALATDDNYAAVTYIAIYSILKVRSCEAEYKFYILISQEFKNENKLLLQELENENADVRILFCEVENNYQEQQTLRHVTSATYFRLLLPNLLKEEKCLYIDQDVIVRRDIKKYLKLILVINWLEG